MHFGLMTSTEIAEELAARLRKHRLVHNMQQSELAGRAGVSEKTVRNFERSGKVSLDVFLRIISALGLSESLTELFQIRARSIREMEMMEVRRQRATRRSARHR